jgi:hypothetical protein
MMGSNNQSTITKVIQFHFVTNFGKDNTIRECGFYHSIIMCHNEPHIFCIVTNETTKFISYKRHELWVTIVQKTMFCYFTNLFRVYGFKSVWSQNQFSNFYNLWFWPFSQKNLNQSNLRLSPLSFSLHITKKKIKILFIYLSFV